MLWVGVKMNKAIKAALLSALVFPGSGQFYLKRYGRGSLLLLLRLLGLTIIVVRATVVALDSLKVMQGAGTAIDANAISRLAETTSGNIFTDNTTILLFLVACWIFSVVDAYRIGKRDLANAEERPEHQV
jgi:TM2 domain-containing membrane protein YozV